jgi:hypothetical protein
MEPAHDLALHLWQPARVKSRLLTVCSAWSTYTYAPWEGVGLAVSPANDIGETVAHAKGRDADDLDTQCKQHHMTVRPSRRSCWAKLRIVEALDRSLEGACLPACMRAHRGNLPEEEEGGERDDEGVGHGALEHLAPVPGPGDAVHGALPLVR